MAGKITDDYTRYTDAGIFGKTDQYEKREKAFESGSIQKRLKEGLTNIWYVAALADYKPVDYDRYRFTVRYIDAMFTLYTKIKNAPKGK